jgi:hypothetical protein
MMLLHAGVVLMAPALQPEWMLHNALHNFIKCMKALKIYTYAMLEMMALFRARYMPLPQPVNERKTNINKMNHQGLIDNRGVR